MVQDEKKYHIVKERQSEDVVVVTYTRKERRCDGCLCNKKGKEIRIVNYPIIHKDMGRLVMRKKICDDCYDDYREIVDNLKYN
jgi:hypothetical protein